MFLSKGARCLGVRSIHGTRMLSSSVFDKVGVVGLGLMGHGIVQVASSSGKHSEVIAYEPTQEYLTKGRVRIESSIAKLVSRGKISKDDADRTLGSIKFTTDLTDFQNVDFIVEAIIENMDLKKICHQCE